MAYAQTDDDVQIYYEETGKGTAIVFVHEFGGDLYSWEPQIRYFSRNYRCIAFNARGYPPSDVPESLNCYSQSRAVQDIVAVMDAAKVEKAHIVGLSMGGFAALHFGLSFGERALSLVVAGVGYGAEKQYENYFKEVSLEVARQFEEQGSERFARVYSLGASRVQYQVKDPRGWREFADRLGGHSSTGSANTMRGVQARRHSIYDMEDELAALSIPTLIVAGDEDDHCLQPGIYMKAKIPTAGLLILPKTGHTLNLEEPSYFNMFVGDFLTAVSLGSWKSRDKRAIPGEVMKTS